MNPWISPEAVVCIISVFPCQKGLLVKKKMKNLNNDLRAQNDSSTPCHFGGRSKLLYMRITLEPPNDPGDKRYMRTKNHFDLRKGHRARSVAILGSLPQNLLRSLFPKISLVCSINFSQKCRS